MNFFKKIWIKINGVAGEAPSFEQEGENPYRFDVDIVTFARIKKGEIKAILVENRLDETRRLLFTAYEENFRPFKAVRLVRHPVGFFEFNCIFDSDGYYAISLPNSSVTKERAAQLLGLKDFRSIFKLAGQKDFRGYLITFARVM